MDNRKDVALRHVRAHCSLFARVVASRGVTAMLESEIIQSLEIVRGKVREQLLNVWEYRAFLAVEKSILEIPELNEIVTCLTLIQDKIKDRLKEIPEYRALRAIENLIAEVHDLLAHPGPLTRPQASSLQTHSPAALLAGLDSVAPVNAQAVARASAG